LEAGGSKLQRGLKGRTEILFEDEVILTNIPSLRTCWAMGGQQASISGVISRERFWPTSLTLIDASL